MTPTQKWLLWGGVAFAVSAITTALAFPKTFQLVARAYGSLTQWAADRGAQIRAAFRVPKDALRPEGTVKPQEMTADAWNARKIATLNPAFRSRFTSFMAAAQRVARSHGKELIIWDAVRTFERQIDLYKQGRVDDGMQVTQVKAGSRHLYGIAIDLAIRTASGSVSFDLPSWYKSEVLPLAAKHRLSSLLLRAGIDPPHIEVPPEDLPDSVKMAAAQIDADFPGLA